MKRGLIAGIVLTMLAFASSVQANNVPPTGLYVGSGSPEPGESLLEMTPEGQIRFFVRSGESGLASNEEVGLSVEAWREGGTPQVTPVGNFVPGLDHFEGEFTSFPMSDFLRGGAFWSGSGSGTVYWRPFKTCTDSDGQSARCEGAILSFNYEVGPDEAEIKACQRAKSQRGPLYGLLAKARRLKNPAIRHRQVKRVVARFAVQAKKIRTACRPPA